MSTSTTGFFQPASVTSNGRPVLHQSEVECHLLSAVDLETEPTTTTTSINSLDFPPLKSGLLTFTTHRLLWFPSNATTDSSSPISISLNSVTHIFINEVDQVNVSLTPDPVSNFYAFEECCGDFSDKREGGY
uniref:GLUE N-terminal domain-containing protein n=1 Tax=Populus trichocarpa TaxID=3694 RepID=A0A3N7FC39_POPTR